MKNVAEIFQDGMILQREKEVNIWGYVKANDLISLTFHPEGQLFSECDSDQVFHIQTKADNTGRWQISLPSHPAGGPYQMQVTNMRDVGVRVSQLELEGAHGRTTDLIRDIYFGDVWLLSGQSNMELPVERITHAYPEVLEQNQPMIRQFQVPLDYHFNGARQDVLSSSWKSATGDDIKTLSAVGYYFAHSLQEALKYESTVIPIGLILCAVGGTPIEAWMKPSLIRCYPEKYIEYMQCMKDDYVSRIQQQEAEDSNIWFQKAEEFDRGLQEEWFRENVDVTDWSTMDLHDSWDENVDLKECGVVWLHKQILIPEEYEGCSGLIEFGCLVDKDEMYFNGSFIGGTEYRYPPRLYPVPSVKAGINVLSIRMTAVHGIGEVVSNKAYELTLYTNPGEKVISLEGEYRYKRSLSCPPLPMATFFQYKPSGTYQAMLAPLTSYGITGFLWYQGESNSGSPEGYAEKFQEMILSWREEFGQGDLPFYYVQLAGYSPKGGSSTWALLREEQAKTQVLQNTGMAVAFDLGETTDIHPLNKRVVGERLALLALDETYGQQLVSRGPSLESISWKQEDINDVNRIVTESDSDDSSRSIVQYNQLDSNQNVTKLDAHDVSFTIEYNVHNSSLEENEAIQGFSLWVDAYEIPVMATTVCGSLDQVHITIPSFLSLYKLQERKHQLFLSYAWADDPIHANLYNVHGLPAEPFKRMI